jgi:hypothetical protein
MRKTTLPAEDERGKQRKASKTLEENAPSGLMATKVRSMMLVGGFC